MVTGYGLCFTNPLIGVRWIMCSSFVSSIKYLSYNFRWPYSRESRKQALTLGGTKEQPTSPIPKYRTERSRG